MRTSLHRFGLRVAVLSAIVLLFAQLGAMSHAYSHDAAIASPTSHTSPANGHEPCNDCLAYAPLLAAAGTSGSLPIIESHPAELAARSTARSLIDLSLSLAFRSRAPPITR